MLRLEYGEKLHESVIYFLHNQITTTYRAMSCELVSNRTQ